MASHIARATFCFAFFGSLSNSILVAADDVANLDHFERHVRPVLLEHCSECHAEEKQESGFRVDARRDLVAGGDRGPGIVPGDSGDSLLMLALSYEDADLSMPPDGKLPDHQISAIAKWIDDGAVWPSESKREFESKPNKSDVSADHWAFQPVRPLRDQVTPEVHRQAWPRNAIDYFVLAKLEQNGMAPSPDADAATLVRRAYFDLIGLPPSWEESQIPLHPTFSEKDFQTVVDALLDRPAYGERWARHWLDVARYADTKGYVDGGQAKFAFAYTYRDYVIRALNEDKPYDEFITEQLAADLLPWSSEIESGKSVGDWRLAATGFLLIGRRFNHNFYDTLDDQIDVITRGVLGLTVSCARCHDHKFDPVSTANYYSLYGILANCDEVSHALLPQLTSSGSTDEYEKYVSDLKKRHDEYEAKYSEMRDAIQHELRAFAGDYLLYVIQESARHRESSQNPLQTKRTLLRGPSAYGYGAFPRWRKFLASRTESDPVFGIWLRMDRVERNAFSAELTMLLELEDSSFNTQLVRSLSEDPPKSMVQLVHRYGQLLESAYEEWTQYKTSTPGAVALEDPAKEQLRQVLYGSDSPCVMTRFESIDCYHLDDHTNMRNLKGKIEELSIDRSDVPGRPMLLTTRTDEIDTAVFVRGQPNRIGPKVPRRIPLLLKTGAIGRDDELSSDGNNELNDDRLALAKAIADRRNPLTARVIVNRVWGWHFGQPLVSTQSDFGLRSKPPTHPELLDYLSAWFMENDWSLKKLHRLIMTSRTYQQSSFYREDCGAVDPDNVLLWRYVPRRLEWEVIRDSLLAVSGKLEPRTGGRPVPKSPDDPDAICRTIYLHLDRQILPNFARDFDFPSPDFTAPSRVTTTVPQQQLFFLNSPFVWNQAQALGKWATGLDEKSDVQRFRALYVRVLSKPPPAVEECERLLALLAQDGEQDTLESWEIVAHALLQSNAFVFVE